MRYATYTLRIEQNVDAPDLFPDEVGAVGNSIQQAEDAVNDALPDGFYCKIDEGGEGVDIASVRRLKQVSEPGC